MIEAAIKKGCEFLATFVRADGTLAPPADGFDYPIYTAALALQGVLAPHRDGFRPNHRSAWCEACLKERQLTEKLGWKPKRKQ